ncbi:MAG: hypothetical protein QF732_11645 [Nitrospinaceae bacterium]|jgi:hypothetical protein|nr:hypothetical protein [Nitrospinaceae bacterium]
MHPDQPRTGYHRCVRENEKADGHRPEFEAEVGGSSRHQDMITFKEEFELMGEITQQQNNAAEGRSKELLTQYFSTDDADLRQIIASDLFKECGLTVEL